MPKHPSAILWRIIAGRGSANCFASDCHRSLDVAEGMISDINFTFDCKLSEKLVILL